MKQTNNVTEDKRLVTETEMVEIREICEQYMSAFQDEGSEPLDIEDDVFEIVEESPEYREEHTEIAGERLVAVTEAPRKTIPVLRRTVVLLHVEVTNVHQPHALTHYFTDRKLAERVGEYYKELFGYDFYVAEQVVYTSALQFVGDYATSAPKLISMLSEKERREYHRRRALSKLSPEERAVLGV